MKNVLIALLLFTPTTSAFAQAPKSALDLNDVVAILEVEGVDMGDRIAMVKRRCVSFRPAESDIAKLRKAGADDAFLGALMTACFTGASEKAVSSSSASTTPSAVVEPVKFFYGTRTNNPEIVYAVSLTEEYVGEASTRAIKQSMLRFMGSTEKVGHIAHLKADGTREVTSFTARAIAGEDVWLSVDVKQANGDFQTTKRLKDKIESTTIQGPATAQSDMGPLGFLPGKVEAVGDTIQWPVLFWKLFLGNNKYPVSVDRFRIQTTGQERIMIDAGSFDAFVGKLYWSRTAGEKTTKYYDVGKVWFTTQAPHVVLRVEGISFYKTELACASGPGLERFIKKAAPVAEKEKDELTEQLMGSTAPKSTATSQPESEAEQRLSAALSRRIPAQQQPALTEKQEMLVDAMSVLFSKRKKGVEVNTAAALCEPQS